ncbi:hypothetical protein BDY17DRAFT_326679 [Neohortaea acidophila]|uniref:Uncharacterized protein n=1 Tax=Neohortaea acidophila TaxID=245834 RepID=A0A6A6PMC3_9PEZI|nr:uncharacterized protein BDY17DRAFT_326679 [Neohortaea acidophila]KAF2480804.1 hypothetical protein BDY17DRAFT_326679 [Neohortaea acidophila]
MPAHLKRGTLSFTISPIRGLKKQKSMHSLRRQMQEAARYGMTSRDRTGSTETIQVLMTPDQRTMPRDNTPSSSGKYQPPRSEEAWATNNARTQPQQPQARTPYATSSRYPSELPPLSMPAPPPLPTGINGRPEFLDSPYTPTKIQGEGGPGGGLAVPGGSSADLRRDTTFSSMMERAGLRKSDLLMGTKKRVDGRFGW